MSREEKTRYDRVIVEDPYRSDAIGQFVRSVVRKERTFEGIAHGAPGIVFCRLQAHAQRLAEAISWELERPVPVVTSNMSKKHRDELVERMKARDPELPVVVACMVWSTGIDIPALEWVLWAGEGQAPIWLKQGAGRATRLEKDKLGFVVFDWQTVGPETEAYQEQAARRMQHYEEGGFTAKPKPERGPAPEGTDTEVELLEQLLAKPSEPREVVPRYKPGRRTEESSRSQVRAIRDEAPVDPREENPFYPYPEIDHRYLKDPWFWFWPWAGFIVCIVLIYKVIQWLRIACNM